MRPDCTHNLEWLERLWQACRRAAPRRAALGLGVLAAVAAAAWLLRPGPQTSDAQGLPTTAPGERLQARTRTVYVRKDLPVVPGRHDRIHRDFFRLHPDASLSPGIEEGGVGDANAGDFSASSPQEVLKQGLQLKAIMVGARRRALINDVIVSVGEKVKLIAAGPNDDEFEVTAIDDQTVSLTRGGEVIVLRLESEVKGHSGGARLSP